MKINKNYAMNGKLDNYITIEEFKKDFEISDKEWESEEKQMNEYGTQDIKFIFENGTEVLIELNNNNLITHIIA